MVQWKCPKCCASNNAHARYCINCGYFVEKKQVAEYYEIWQCPICKEKNEEDVAYCRKCGHWLLSETHRARKVVNRAAKKSERPNFANRSILILSGKRTSKVFITELVLLAVASVIIVNGEGSVQHAMPYILPWIFIIHLFFSLLYVTRDLFRTGLVRGLLTLVKQVVLLGFLLLLVGAV